MYGSFSYGSASYGGGIAFIFQKSVSDVGLGVDTISAKEKISISDVGSGVDTISAITVKISIQETGTGIDTIGINKTIPITDSGQGTDIVGIVIRETILVADSGQGAETIGITITDTEVNLTDNGQGTDTIGIKQGRILTDSGQGLEAFKSSTTIFSKFAIYDEVLFDETLYDGYQIIDLIKILIADSGQGIDTIGIKAAVLIADSGVGIDAISIKAAITVQDSGIGVDTVGIKNSILIQDNGQGIDTISIVIVSLSSLLIQDSGKGIDTARMKGIVGRCLSERPKGNEIIKIAVRTLISIQDTAVGADLAQKEDIIKVLDNGQAVEFIMPIIPRIPIQETLRGIDSIRVPLSYFDKYENQNDIYYDKYISSYS